MFTADFEPEELGLTPVYCRNIPGTSVGHLSEAVDEVGDDDDMNDFYEHLTETESTRTPSMSPARRLQDVQDENEEDA